MIEKKFIQINWKISDNNNNSQQAIIIKTQKIFKFIKK